MVRTVSAVAIFTITVIFCVMSLFYLKKSSGEVAENVSSAVEFLHQEKVDSAIYEIDVARKKWEKAEKVLKIFIDHNHLGEISVDFAELKSNLSSSELTQSLALCESILIKIKGLEETEEPYLENIL